MTFDEWLDNQLAFWEGLRFGTQETQQSKLLKLVRAYHELDCINAELYPDADWEKRGEIAALEAALMGEK